MIWSLEVRVGSQPPERREAIQQWKGRLNT